MTDTTSTFDDARQWRDRAEEMRMVAEGMRSEQNKKIALQLAADYDRLAMHAEHRARRGLQECARSHSRAWASLELIQLRRPKPIRHIAEAKETLSGGAKTGGDEDINAHPARRIYKKILELSPV